MYAPWLAAAAAALLSLSAHAEPLRLGAVTLTDARDRDVLALADCEGPGNAPVTRLKLRVSDHPAQIDHLVVEFGNGDRQNLEVKHHFRVGDESRWIDMAGPARCVRKIKIVGDADTVRRTPNKTARVAFWGEAIGGGEVAPHHEGPGERDFLGKVRLTDRPDRDVLDLPACPTGGNHPVRQLKLTVSDHRAELNRVRVVFENGSEVVVDVNRVFAAGEHSEWKDLPGEARCIDRIVVLGDTQSLGRRPGKQATVSFFGR